MSSNRTIFLTKNNEHCFENVMEDDGDDKFRVYIEVAKENIKSFTYDDDDGLIIGINGASQLADILRKIR